MSDLRELFHAGAPATDEPDLVAVRTRAASLARRQRVARTGAAAVLVAALGAGALAVAGDGGGQDRSTVVAESPDAPGLADDRDAPGEVEAGARVDGDVEVDEDGGSAGVGAEAGAAGVGEVGTEGGSNGVVEDGEGGGEAAPPPTADPAPSDTPAAPPTGPAPARAGTAGGSTRFDDPAGDVTGDPRVSSVGRDTEGEPRLDAVEGELRSDGRTLTVVTRVVDLQDGPPPGADGSAYLFSFDHEVGDTRHRVLVDIQRYNDSQFIRLLVSGGGRSTSDPCEGCTAAFDGAGDTVTGTVPLDVLDAALRAVGGDPAGGGTASDPLVETFWVDSPNRAEDCEQPESFRTVCSSQAAGADRAEGRGSIALR